MKNRFVYEDTGKMICAAKIEPIENYCLRISFTNGKVKKFDVKPLLNQKIYSPLKSKFLFNSVYLSCGSAAWSDEIDICPENLYWDSVLEAELQKA